MPSVRSASHLARFWPFAGALLCLALFHALGASFLYGHALDLGRSLNAPTPGYGRFLALWTFFGGLSAALLGAGLVRAAAGSEARLAGFWSRSCGRRWMLYGSLLGGLLPAFARTWLLGGARLTDDEAAYRFMAQVLASGRLWADSPPLKLFFDSPFLVNDGKLYAHYFVGWPALQAPGVWLGIPGFMNAFYSALTVPAVFLVLRRIAGAGWARAGVVLYLASPMLMVAAATETSHSSCLAALAWATWLVLRSRDEDASWKTHAGVALAFSAAFFIRPTSALGVGLPLLACWALGLRRRDAAGRRRALLAFLPAALVMAGLFLGVNQLQNGSPFTTAYQRAFEYAAENGFRFSYWPESAGVEGMTELGFRGLGRSLAVAGAALFRLDAELFGWPSSLLFAALTLFSLRAPARALLWSTVGCYLLVHATADNVGIDSFAPMHYFELAWPLLLLTACGLADLHAALRRAGLFPALPAALAAALVAVTLAGFLPPRLGALHRIAENVRLPEEALAEQGISRAVVFAAEPFIAYCRSQPATGWVFHRPNSDPALAGDVLWANHLSLEKDRQLMRHFPERSGWVMVWDPSCRVVFLPLDELPPGAVPDARVDSDDLGDDLP